MKKYIQNIINFFLKNKGIDLSVYKDTFIENIINNRILINKLPDIKCYHDYIIKNDNESELLLSAVNISSSEFFRGSFTFEYLSNVIIPSIITQNNISNKSLRIWSSCCSTGEEAYSIAIILKELFRIMDVKLKLFIFASDVSEELINYAKIGKYIEEKIQNVKYNTLNDYFKKKNNKYFIVQEIKDMVNFSKYNLLSNKKVLTDSIFGDFDLILCRNLLMYYKNDVQNFILKKLYNSLKKDGYLILGESEFINNNINHKFNEISKHCKIYQKKI